MSEKNHPKGRVFYVDYENAALTGATGCERLNKNDKIIIFIPGGEKSISGNSAKAFIGTKAKIRFVNVSVGKTNALDFQLVMYVGLKYKKDREHYIISNDKGYDYAVNMCIELGYENVHRYSNISDAVDGVDNIANIQTERLRVINRKKSAYQSFCHLLKNKCGIEQNQTVYNDIFNAVDSAKNKLECFHTLRKKYKSPNKKCELYDKIKDHYADISALVQKNKELAASRVCYMLKYECKLPYDEEIYTDINKALVETDDKNEFYQFLFKKYGQKTNKVPFYDKIKNKYIVLKKAADAQN